MTLTVTHNGRPQRLQRGQSRARYFFTMAGYASKSLPEDGSSGYRYIHHGFRQPARPQLVLQHQQYWARMYPSTPISSRNLYKVTSTVHAIADGFLGTSSAGLKRSVL